MDNRVLSRSITDVLDTLSTKEKLVVQMYFGLSPMDRSYILEEIGDHLGVTMARAQQIKEKALTRLRHPSRSKSIRDFYDD